ncbi:cyclic di-AMP synthase CdaA [Kroppenstedtia guangzhouensis]|jgi:diadenylate cyclase|uniref:Diadenylate cyclase n=1 Tax=Kroppenstedtia guangzhouensis TaxID=1274356 RepID=A0ABQ1GQM8_9BACL|nr:diadenylate cyclase CdaA [Kroppenstedtia guangzhouensis]GGA48388.1 cyclic di-AMP synthase CdaA [Kroppenstedtia guangzhouensis]
MSILVSILDGITQYVNVIVDILIVSYIIYKLLMLVRGTRAVQLLKGISVVLAVWMLSSLFQLSTLQWLMENLFSWGIIVVIIIFQPELRRALEQLGRGRFFSRSAGEDEQMITRIVGDMVKAVSYLAKRRIGALIVVERRTGLSDYVESGIRLDADLNSEILSNIFTPKAPLHDGAVIIRRDRIAAAGCYLPLSENPFISNELGTRHRAGMGISELTDAVTIIVSEETGQISLAIQGQLERGLSEEEMISRLYEELKPSGRQTSFWNRKGEKDG